jgi:hypothetical protein
MRGNSMKKQKQGRRRLVFSDDFSRCIASDESILQVEYNRTWQGQFRMKDRLLYPVLGSAVTLVLHFATGLGWGLSAFASFVGWPLVGTLVTADDDLPGGWSNPDGTIPPAWRTAAAWGQLSVGFAIASFVAALEAGLRTSVGAGFAVASAAAGILALVLLRRRQR